MIFRRFTCWNNKKNYVGKLSFSRVPNCCVSADVWNYSRFLPARINGCWNSRWLKLWVRQSVCHLTLFVVIPFLLHSPQLSSIVAAWPILGDVSESNSQETIPELVLLHGSNLAVCVQYITHYNVNVPSNIFHSPFYLNKHFILYVSMTTYNFCSWNVSNS
jgi:hypothetical protein